MCTGRGCPGDARDRYPTSAGGCQGRFAQPRAMLFTGLTTECFQRNDLTRLFILVVESCAAWRFKRSSEVPNSSEEPRLYLAIHHHTQWTINFYPYRRGELANYAVSADYMTGARTSKMRVSKFWAREDEEVVTVINTETSSYFGETEISTSLKTMRSSKGLVIGIGAWCLCGSLSIF